MSGTDLRGWGLDADAAAAWADGLARPGAVIGRVIEEHLGGLWVMTAAGPVLTRSAGRLRRSHVGDPTRRPAVGDWVLVVVEAGAGGRATLHDLWPRRTALVRRAAGDRAVAQVVAANVDHVWILCPVAAPSPRRAERWLALARAGGALPSLIVTKGDLGGTDDAVAALTAVAAGAAVHVVASHTGVGVAALRATVALGETTVLVGSSGVGKSTLVNAIAGEALRATQEIRSDGKGRHTTTARALVRGADGLLLLDTPGIRELGMALADEGLDDAFAEITTLAAACRFRDCRHGPEPGCAVRAAIAAGTLDGARLDRFLALGLESAATSRVLNARTKRKDG